MSLCRTIRSATSWSKLDVIDGVVKEKTTVVHLPRRC